MEFALPKELSNSCLPKSVRGYVWKSVDVNRAVGARNDNEAREWFREHGELLKLVEQYNEELRDFVEQLRGRFCHDIVVAKMGELNFKEDKK